MSLFNCQRTKLTLDEASKLQPSMIRLDSRCRISGCRTLSGSSFDELSLFSKPRGDHSAHPNPGGGEGIRTPDPRVANAVLCQLSYTPRQSKSEIQDSKFKRGWLRGRDLNPRPLGYEPNELPDCSTPRQSQPQVPTPFP